MIQYISFHSCMVFSDSLFQVPGTQVEFGLERADGPENGHQEYFDYGSDSLSMPLPNDWEEGLEMFKNIKHIALHGYLV